MCETKPGPRCAADTRHVAQSASAAYNRAYPGGPPVNPITSASAQFTAGSSALVPRTRWQGGHDAASVRAHQLLSHQAAASAGAAMRALDHLAAIGKRPVPQTI